MKTILIVEDEKDIRTSLQEIFLNENFNALTASDGTEGYQIALSQQPDLILSDIIMPGMSGFELLEKLQSEPNTAVIPVIFLTGMVEIENMRKGMDCGADDYLLKPFRIDDVLNSINARLKKTEIYNSVIDEFKNSLVQKTSHEMRTPLVGILGFAQLLSENFETISRKEHRQFIENINASGKRLYRRIEKFLFYAELLSLKRNRGETNVKGPDEYHIDNNYLKAKLSCKAAEFDRADDLDISFESADVIIEARALEMLLEELIENSAKFTAKGSSIAALGYADGEYYVVRISDEGTGNENLNFNKENILMTGNTFVEGIGIGLSMVKRITELYNCRLKMSSISGSGTNVEIILPRIEVKIFKLHGNPNKNLILH